MWLRNNVASKRVLHVTASLGTGIDTALGRNSVCTTLLAFHPHRQSLAHTLRSTGVAIKVNVIRSSLAGFLPSAQLFGVPAKQ